MDRMTFARGQMALIGALAGLSLFALSEVVERGLVADRAALGLASFATVFFFGWLAMAGPLPHRRAALGAAATGAVAGGLITLASLRFASVETYLEDGIPVLAAFVLGAVPLPFLIAARGPGWRHYPTLFTQSWSIVVRYSAALLFVGVVWAVIYLSDALFGVVGLNVIEAIIETPGMPWVITGATLGLALAVVTELSDLVSPDLLLRLLRLLLPAVLLVMVVFLLALPLRGLSGLFGGLSVAGILLAMAGVSATLVTSAVDQDDATVAVGPLMSRASQALALILIAPAALGAWAVWLRVAQHGLTPDRILAALIAAMMIGYGVIYAVAVLRGTGWMARIRSANVTMALVLVGAAALWLTPVLDAERMSARSMVARITDGRLAPSVEDIIALERWGRAGARAREDLASLAEANPALALALEGAPEANSGLPSDLVSLREIVVAEMPVNPGDATAVRDSVLEAVQGYDLTFWITSCRATLPQGQPGCVMVVADLVPAIPGAEVVILQRDVSGYMIYDGYARIDGLWQRRNVSAAIGALPDISNADTLIAALQTAPLRLEPVPFNQIVVGETGLMIQP